VLKYRVERNISIFQFTKQSHDRYKFNFPKCLVLNSKLKGFADIFRDCSLFPKLQILLACNFYQLCPYGFKRIHLTQRVYTDWYYVRAVLNFSVLWRAFLAILKHGRTKKLLMCARTLYFTYRVKQQKLLTSFGEKIYKKLSCKTNLSKK
jgi:hypothetical protein